MPSAAISLLKQKSDKALRKVNGDYMSKMDSILDRAMRIGKDIEQRKTAKALEQEQAVSAVTEASMEMERAALAGDEAAYAQAKEKRNASENRLEILRIRLKKGVGKENLEQETASALQALESNGIEEMRKMCGEFLQRYDELLKLVDAIDNDSQRYNQVQEYYKSYVMKSNEYRPNYMAELLPIAHIISFRDKFKYQRGEIAKAVNR